MADSDNGGGDQSPVTPDDGSESLANNSTGLSEDVQRAGFYLALVMLFFCVVGSVGNALSVVIFLRPSMRNSPINILLSGLSMVDLVMLVAAVPAFVAPTLNQVWSVAEPRVFYMLIVFGVYQACMIAQTCSVWLFVLISVERYLAVSRPLHVGQLLTASRARLAVVGVFMSSMVYNAPRFFEYQLHNDSYQPLLRDSQQYFAIYYTTMYLLTHFLVPFLTIAALNAMILHTMQSAKRLRRRMTHGDLRIDKALQSHRMTRMIVIVTVIFGVCNVLPLVLNVWEALEPRLFLGPHRLSAYLMLDVSNLLVVLNSSTSFIVYGLFCKRYRVLLVQMLLGWRRSCRVFRPRLAADDAVLLRKSNATDTLFGRICRQLGIRWPLLQRESVSLYLL